MSTTTPTSSTPVPSPPGDAPTKVNARRLREATGVLTQAAIRRLVDTEPWYQSLSVRDRSYLGLVAQAGINSFVTWYENPSAPPTDVGEMFAAAPPELTRSIPLQHTLQIVRIAVDVVEDHASRIAEPGTLRDLREAVLWYSREIAFSAASVYARAAEVRGAWDARLEAAVVDAIVHGDDDGSVASRAPALGWKGSGSVAVAVGSSLPGLDDFRAAQLRKAARKTAGDALVSIQDDLTFLVLGGPGDHTAEVESLGGFFGPGRVVVGPSVSTLADATESAAAALAGLRAAPAYPGTDRLLRADDLLPERALAGDPVARRRLVAGAFTALVAAGGGLVETLGAYLAAGRSLEAAARGLYVHPNTVRYRLRKVAEVTGWDPLDARESFVLHIALTVGALDAAVS